MPRNPAILLNGGRSRSSGRPFSITIRLTGVIRRISGRLGIGATKVLSRLAFSPNAMPLHVTRRIDTGQTSHDARESQTGPGRKSLYGPNELLAGLGWRIEHRQIDELALHGEIAVVHEQVPG